MSMYNWKRKKSSTAVTEKISEGVTWLSFPALEETGLVTHAFSTRMGGVSKGAYSTMNFSYTRGDDPEGGYGAYGAYVADAYYQCASRNAGG